MDAALSPNGRRLLRVLFFAVVVFLYAPIAILLLFSFNDSVLPTFPLSGFTLTWYRQFVHDSELIGALETSALVAVLSSLGSTVSCSSLIGHAGFTSAAAVSVPSFFTPARLFPVNISIRWCRQMPRRC